MPTRSVRRRKVSRLSPVCDVLERRALLSTIPSIGRVAAVETAAQAVRLTLPVDTDRFTFARDGRVAFNIRVEAEAGSGFTPGRVVLRTEQGRLMPVALHRMGQQAFGRLELRPGEYDLVVRGRGRTTGAFRVSATLQGDVNGDRAVDAEDLRAIHEDMNLQRRRSGPLPYNPVLDLNRDGVIGGRDLQMVRSNLAAADHQLPLVIANSTGQFASKMISVAIYAKNSALVDAATNPGGWAYADKTGAWHSVFGLTQVPTFALSELLDGTISLVTQAGGNPIDLESGQVYFGLGSAIVLPVNTGVTAVTVNAGGTGYGDAPGASFVSFSGGGGNGAAGTATVVNGVVTSVAVTATGNGYASAPSVQFNGDGGSGASATALIQVLGIAAPNPSSPTDPNNGVIWGFVEFSRPSGSPLTLNSDVSQVDQFGFPLTLQTDPLATGFSNGVGITMAQADVIAAYQTYIQNLAVTFPKALAFLDSVQPVGTAASAPSRILAPKDVIPLYSALSKSTNLSTYYDANIAQIFTVGNTKTGVTSVYAGTTYTFNAEVVSENGYTIYRFTDVNDVARKFDIYSPLTPPSWVANPFGATQMVFANNGVFADNVQQYPTDVEKSTILGNLENQLVSAMSRGVAHLAYADWLDTSKQYVAPATANYYAGFFHQATVSIGGFAYGFAFDDQGNASTDMSTPGVSQVCIRLGWSRAILPACDVIA